MQTLLSAASRLIGTPSASGEQGAFPGSRNPRAPRRVGMRRRRATEDENGRQSKGKSATRGSRADEGIRPTMALRLDYGIFEPAASRRFSCVLRAAARSDGPGGHAPPLRRDPARPNPRIVRHARPATDRAYASPHFSHTPH